MTKNSESDIDNKDCLSIEHAFDRLRKITKGNSREMLQEMNESAVISQNKVEKKVVSFTPLQIGYNSDVGSVRAIDEDSIVVIDYSTMFESAKFRKIFACVADGMGGYSKGEIASCLAINIISKKVMPIFLSKNIGEVEYEEILRVAFQEANNIIINHALKHPEYMSMGTTASVIIIDGDRIHIGHVGDTRVYIINNNGINQITKDHSLVQKLLDEGKISKEDARKHPQKNVITRAIGVGSFLEADVFSRAVIEGDYVLLCCDGLVNEVEDQEVMNLVLSSETLQTACDRLVELANQRGGKDNISIIVIGPLNLQKPKTQLDKDETQPVAKALENLAKMAISYPDQTKPSMGNANWCESCGQPLEIGVKRCICGAEVSDQTISEKR